MLWGNEEGKEKKGLSPIISELSRGRSQQKRMLNSKELGIKQREHSLTKPKEENVSRRVIGNEC